MSAKKLSSMKIVPFSEQNRIMLYYHTNNFHCNSRQLVYIIQKDGYDWFNIYDSCNNFCLNCKACSISRKAVYKKPEIKQIVPDFPKEEYQLDITELPKELITSKGERYLLSIIDTFSKFADNYIQNSKNSKLVLGNLKNFINKYDAQKRIHTDNGGEFVNKYMKEFLESKGI